MAPPEKRAAAPGTQVVRTDTAKAKSWVDVTRTTGRIGQIFFATDDATLDFHDMAELQKIVDAYPKKLNADRNRTISFMYNGYADYRHTKDHNYDLSKRRAQAVADFVGDKARLGGYPNYSQDVRGMGVDYSVDLEHDKRPTASADLAPYRRVDIMAEGVTEPQPTPDPPREKPLRSRQWKAQMLNSASLGVGPIQGDVFWLRIVDLKNKLSMIFRYQGLGFGVSPGKLPKMGKMPPVSGGQSSASDWVFFDTYVEVNIMEFEGWTLHISAQGQFSIGASADWVILMGPHDRRGAVRVSLLFKAVTIIDRSAGMGAGTTGGTLQPSRDNNGKPRPWDAD